VPRNAEGKAQLPNTLKLTWNLPSRSHKPILNPPNLESASKKTGDGEMWSPKIRSPRCPNVWRSFPRRLSAYPAARFSPRAPIDSKEHSHSHRIGWQKKVVTVWGRQTHCITIPPAPIYEVADTPSFRPNPPLKMQTTAAKCTRLLTSRSPLSSAIPLLKLQPPSSPSPPAVHRTMATYSPAVTKLQRGTAAPVPAGDLTSHHVKDTNGKLLKFQNPHESAGPTIYPLATALKIIK